MGSSDLLCCFLDWSCVNEELKVQQYSQIH